MATIDTKEISALFVSEKLPEVANALRAEGAKSVNTDEIKASAAKAEREKAEAEIATAKVSAAQDERKRIATIRDMAMAGSDELVAKAIENGTTPEAFAVEQLAFLKKNAGKTSAQTALETAEEVAKGVGAQTTTDPKHISQTAKAEADLKSLRALGIKV